MQGTGVEEKMYNIFEAWVEVSEDSRPIAERNFNNTFSEKTEICKSQSSRSASFAVVQDCSTVKNGALQGDTALKDCIVTHS